MQFTFVKPHQFVIIKRKSTLPLLFWINLNNICFIYIRYRRKNSSNCSTKYLHSGFSICIYKTTLDSENLTVKFLLYFYLQETKADMFAGGSGILPKIDFDIRHHKLLDSFKFPKSLYTFPFKNSVNIAPE